MSTFILKEEQTHRRLVARENEINLSSKETTSGTAKSEIKKTGRSRGKSCMFFSEDVSESWGPSDRGRHPVEYE